MRVAVNSHALPIYMKNRIASLLCIFETIINPCDKSTKYLTILVCQKIITWNDLFKSLGHSKLYFLTNQILWLFVSLLTCVHVLVPKDRFSFEMSNFTSS